MKRNIQKILSFILVLVFCCTFFAGCRENNEYPEMPQEYYEREFPENLVKIGLDCAPEDMFVTIEPSSFGKLKVKSVTDSEYGRSESFQQYLMREGKRFTRSLTLELFESGKQKVWEAVCYLQTLPNIEYAQPDWIDYGQAYEVANDTYFSSQWGLNGENGINICNAWDINEGADTIRVGVIDSGVYAHEDLNLNLTTGYNFWEQNTNTNDTIGHGTHVAGIIGAVGDNHLGISGVCKNIQIVPLKISINGIWPVALAINAINYATMLWGTDAQIDILNFSGGGFGNDHDFKNAINNFPGLFICAAGNGQYSETEEMYVGQNLDSSPDYPSSFNFDNIVVVGSTDSAGVKSTFSNYGNVTVDIFAPGGNIYSTIPGNAYSYMSGTSMAAPHVAGVAALLLSQYPYLTTSELKQTILQNATDVPALNGYCVSGGRLNAYSALSNPIHDSLSYTSDGANGHTADCLTCGYTETLPHNLEMTYNGLKHTWTCAECGYSVSEKHQVVYANLGIETGHKKSCEICAYEAVWDHIWLTFPSYYKCSACLCKTTVIPIYFEDLPIEIQQMIENGQWNAGGAVALDGHTYILNNGVFYVAIGEMSATEAFALLQNELAVDVAEDL